MGCPNGGVPTPLDEVDSYPYSSLLKLTFLGTNELCSYRLVSSSRQTDMIVFNIRCGTGEGVITHHLRAEAHRDLAAWARILVQGAHQCVANQRELIFRKFALPYLTFIANDNANEANRILLSQTSRCLINTFSLKAVCTKGNRANF